MLHHGREIARARARDTARRGGPARTARPRCHSRAATSATICCASTSSGCSGIVSRSSSPRRDAVEQRRALDQVVARQREQPALRRAVDRVARAPDALQEARDRARRAELADQIDVADVDAELERGGRDQRLELAALQPLLGVEPLLLGEAAVVRASTCSSPRRSDSWRVTRSAMPARVDEDQRGAMRLDQLAPGGRRPAPRPRPTSPLRAATAAPRARGRARGDGRCR